MATFIAKIILLNEGRFLEAVELDDVVGESFFATLDKSTTSSDRGFEVDLDDMNVDEANEDNRLEEEIEHSFNKEDTLGVEIKSAKDINKSVDRINEYLHKILKSSPKEKLSHEEKSTLENKYRKQLLREMKHRLVGSPKCSHCKAYPLLFRKEGTVKIFLAPLQKRIQAIMDAKGFRFSEEQIYAKLASLRKARYHASGSELPISSEKLVNPKELSSKSQKLKASNLKEVHPDMNYDEARSTQQFLNPSTIMAILELVWSSEGPFLDLYFNQMEANMKTVVFEANNSYRCSVSHKLCFFEVLAVPPTKFRPPAKMGDMTFDHPQNTSLSEVLKCSQSIRDYSALLASLGSADVTERNKILNQINDQWLEMQNSVNSLIDSTKNPTMTKSGKAPPPGIRQILEKKEGLFRKHMMGKRVNYAARSVISPDPWIETSEIGIPPVFAKKLTYPEPVTDHNVKELMNNVVNGPDIWPGASHIQLEDGQMQSLGDLSQDQRAALAAQLLTPQQTMSSTSPSSLNHTNKKVYRHLRNGDILLLNRQPTLHKPSIMAHKARVLPGERTLRLHYANCNTYNADFDGDEMNVHFPQNEVARAEAYLIANTDNQYLVPTDGSPLRGLIQDHVITGVRLCARNTFINRDEYQQLLMGSLPKETMAKGPFKLLPPAILKPSKLWTGKQVISTLLCNLLRGRPPLNLISKAKVNAKYWGLQGAEEAEVCFCYGDLVTGVLDKSQFGASEFGLVHSVYELYGAEMAGKLLGSLSRLFSKYLQMTAFSCRMDDLLLSPEGNKWRTDLIVNGAQFGMDVAMQYTKSKSEDSLPLELESVLREDEKLAGLDSAMKSKMNGLTSSIISKCLPEGLIRVFPENGMQLMTVSGAKGSNVNVSQISCCLGQQELEGRRVPIMVSGKSLPSFVPYEPSARAGGFISGRFLTGIKPQEYYFHCMAGREGLIDTAVKTSRSGYLQRCLVKHLEGMRVHYDGSVRDSDGSLLQFYYGEDGLDVTKQKHLNQFQFCAENYVAIQQRYRPEELLEKIDEDTALRLSKQIKKKRSSDTTLSKLSPYVYLGSTSEKFSRDLDHYLDENPEKVLYRKEKKHFNNVIVGKAFQALMRLKYLRSLVEPGEAVGVLAAQSIGEPSTQMTLNTFHFAGFGAKNVTLGIPRLREIVMTASSRIKTPAMTLTLHEGISDIKKNDFCKRMSKLTLSAITKEVIVREHLSRAQFSRVRKYRIRLNLFEEADYNHVYSLSASDVQKVIQKRFIKRLEVLIAKELKRAAKKDVKKDAENQAEDDNLITVRDVPSFRSQSQNDDEEVRPGKENDADSNDEGDATASKYASRKKEKASYDDDDEEKVVARKSDSESESSSDDDSQSSKQNSPMLDDSIILDELKNSTTLFTDFKFDIRQGSWVEIEATLPGDWKKLLMVQLVEQAAFSTVIHEVPGIDRCFPTQNDSENDKTVRIGTEGVNLRGMWDFAHIIDSTTIYTNDIAAILNVYGVEAARMALIKEIAGVFDVYGISVDKRHLTVIADYMVPFTFLQFMFADVVDEFKYQANLTRIRLFSVF
jgi:DNA-directed RNA polymerase I subunit RPA1